MEVEVIFAATITLVILVTIIIIFFVIFQTKKNHYIIEKHEAEKRFEEEIEKSQTEIREQSLKNIAWELHDNVGQLLSIAKLQLGILEPKLPIEQQESVSEINKLIGDSLQEIRILSKTLNAEVIHMLGLVEAIELELERFNKLRFLSASLEVIGTPCKLEQKTEIIIFRILQEFFSNVIKHSQADSLDVTLDYSLEKLLITAQDNGVGFDPQLVQPGSGLINMESRSKLIGVTFSMITKKDSGVKLKLEYNFNNNKI